MKDRAFSNPVVISVVTMVVAILLPMPAFAAVCFQNQFGDTFVIEVAGQGDSFSASSVSSLAQLVGLGLSNPGKVFRSLAVSIFARMGKYISA